VLLVPTLVDLFLPDADMQLRSKLMGWLILVSLPVFGLLALVTICVAIIMWRFPIDRARQQELRAELAAR
jgi:Na+/melibiose symporter-like transporter